MKANRAEEPPSSLLSENTIKMISEQLKEHTREVHAATEKQLVGLIKQLSKADDYARLLELFYSYFHPIEQQIMETLPSEILPDLERRRKTAAILYDLRDLTARSELSVAISTAIPKINTPYQALGALYVVEGSTLGGKVIANMISQRLNLGAPFALSFFSSYGDRAFEMWNDFKSAINNMVLTPAQSEELLQAAYETFRMFGNWIHEKTASETARG